MVDRTDDSDDQTEPDTGDNDNDNEALMRRPDELGATETQLVPATPRLDL